MKQPERSPDLRIISLYCGILVLLSWLIFRFGSPSSRLPLFLALGALAAFHGLAYHQMHQNQQRLRHLNQVLLGVRNVNQLLVSEDDPLRLIDRACVNLTETMGYPEAWLVLLDTDDGTVMASAASGFSNRFAALEKQLAHGDTPPCVTQALASPHSVLIAPKGDCMECPLTPEHDDLAKLSRRLHHKGQTYGVLTVTIPAAFAHDAEELALFNEVSEDIAFALHKIAAARRLRESEQAYSTLFNQSVVGIYLHDLAGNILDVNQVACQQSGYSKEELLHMRIFDLHADAPDTPNLPQDEILRRWQQWEPERSYSFEAEHQRKDGTRYPIGISTGVIQYADRRCIQAIVQDMTESQRAKQKLLHSHELMRYVIEHDRSAVAVHDRDLNYIYVSQRYLDDYRVEDPDVIGKHHYEVFPDLPQKWRDVHQRALNGEIISAEDDPFERDDGTVDWTRWECRPWYEADGTIGGIIVYTEIITQRREMEHYLQRQERLAAVGQLAAGITHDFRNLITTIIAYGQLGRRTTDLSPQVARYLDIIVAEARKATDLVGQILDFSRSTEIDRQPLDLVAFVDSVVTILRRTIPSTVSITVEADGVPCMIDGDAGRLQQALINLALNARDAMPDGGTLHIGVTRIAPDAAPPLPTLIQASPPPAWICLSVADTGTGMSKDALDHLFEPFFTTKEVGKGTGLGLAQVYGIVKLHGGHIDVKTAPGQGFALHIYLPQSPHTGSPTAGN